jgi:hypothetical protein
MEVVYTRKTLCYERDQSREVVSQDTQWELCKMGKYLVSLLGLVASLGVAVPAHADMELVSLATGRCLGVQSANKTSGSKVVTYSCDGTLNQRWNQAGFWASPYVMFSRLTTRVLEQTLPGSPPQAGNRCLGLSGTNAQSLNCNVTSADPDHMGWWMDYAGDYTVGGISRHCATIKSKTAVTGPIKYLTGTGAQLAQAYLSTQIATPVGNTQIWCIIPH